jgi:hypothetical protein
MGKDIGGGELIVGTHCPPPSANGVDRKRRLGASANIIKSAVNSPSRKPG